MAKSQNSKFKCFSGILRSLLYIGNLPTQPSDPPTDIPTTTTTFENPKKNFKTQVRTPGVATRLMGLDLLPNPRKVFRRKEDQKEKLDVDGRPPNVIAKLMGLDGQPPQQPLHRQHKGFSETYRQRTAPVSSQRDGKPYEHRSNRKDSTAQQECKDEHDVLETSNVERSSYPVKRTINSKLSEAEMAFIQEKFMADHGTFGQVFECLDNENLEHLAMMERLLGPLPQHMIIKIFQEECTFGLARGCKLQRKYEGSLEITPPTDSQNSKFKCFSGILRSLLYIGNLPTQPSDPTTDIPTTTTTFENPKKNFKTQVRTPGVAARLMGLDLLPNPKKVFRRKEDQKEKLDVDGRPPNVIAKLMGLDGLPPQLPLHRQHKGFPETYRQRTAPVSSQRDGKPYEHRSNRKDSTAQQECKDEHDVLETSNVERSSYPVKRTINSKLSEVVMAFIQEKFMADHGTFGQVFECLDNENLEHLAMMERLLGPLPQHMIISTDLRAEKYFKRSARLD
ncbi:unnamed protein product [Camellia sinensis]